MSDLRDRVRVVAGDITQLDVDAIVNAANQSLLGGGGVDGAIHEAAGPELLAECRTLGGCATGEAKITGGYRLPAKYVIHTVGPIYQTGLADEPEQLRRCYQESLRLAAEKQVTVIAFPCISTGAFGYPREEACDLATSVVLEWLAQHEFPRRVNFSCFAHDDARLYRRVLAEKLP